MKSSIYIDDTGTPSQKSKSKYDSGDWNTWIAYFLTSSEESKLNIILKEACNKLNSQIGTKEFHFADIYSGNKHFKGIDLETRLSMFAFFSEIYNKGNYPILVQSLTSDDIIRNKQSYLKGLKIDGFNFSKNSDLALFFLLLNAEKYILENNDLYPSPVSIFIDEGRQSPETSQKVSLLSKVTVDGKIHYKSSTDTPLLQMADFIAFSFNRARWIMMNDKRSDFDILFLRIIEFANFNFINIKKRKIDLNNFSVTDYDSLLRTTYNSNGNLTDAEVDNIKQASKKK